MKVTVVIPAHNEESNLGRCLHCLGNQTLSKDQFEVVLVDNGSTDSTVEVGRSFAGRLNLRIVSKAQGTISSVRNYGVTFASGEIIAFLDADCMAPNHWLLEAINQRPPASVWGAHYLIPEDANWVSKTWFAYQARAHEGVVSFLPAGDLFITRSDFDRLQGFDESLQTSEDVDLCLRASGMGLRVVALPVLGVIHEGSPRDLSGFYRQNRWHGKHVLKAFLRNLPSSKNAFIVAMSFYTLVLFWLTLASVIAAFIWHLWFLPLLTLGLLLLPPFTLALVKTVRDRSIRSLTKLWILYMTYLLARAAALTHLTS